MAGWRPPVLRVARPTDDIAALLGFYCDGLGFVRLDGFEDHEAFDGVMLGHPDWPYHLEFTRRRDYVAGKAPSRDNLLVFYLPDACGWRAAVDRMERAGFPSVPSENPYWDRQGCTFEDRDGYRVVLQNAGSPV